jgi:hypothetical protein
MGAHLKRRGVNPKRKGVKSKRPCSTKQSGWFLALEHVPPLGPNIYEEAYIFSFSFSILSE